NSPDFSRLCLRRVSSAGEPSHHWTRSGVVSWCTCSTQSATAGERLSRAVKEWGAVAISSPQLSVCPDETTEYSGEPQAGNLKKADTQKGCDMPRLAFVKRNSAPRETGRAGVASLLDPQQGGRSVSFLGCLAHALARRGLTGLGWSRRRQGGERR